MTDTGCQQCGENTYSGDGASSCSNCPNGMISAAGSTSVSDCVYGKKTFNFLIEKQLDTINQKRKYIRMFKIFRLICFKKIRGRRLR